MKGRLLYAALLVLATTACGDPLSLKAGLAVSEDTVVVYAITGTPLAAPSALRTISHTPLPLPASSFDIAFDIDAQGQVVLYPAQLIGSGFGQTGLFKQPGAAFESVTRAPDVAYDESAPLTAGVGDLILVRARPLDCANAIRREIYSKLAITAVNPATRGISVRIRVDPNCGFRDFRDGIPKD